MEQVGKNGASLAGQSALGWMSASPPAACPSVRSRYRPPVLHAGADATFACLDRRYRWLRDLSRPLAIASAVLGLVNIALQGLTPGVVWFTTWTWVAFLAAAAAWHLLPPSFAAPDLGCRVARSIDPLSPASEWDEQLLRMTRFALMIAATWVLMANDLLREAKLRFYDSITLAGSSPDVQAAVDNARASAQSTWANMSLLVLGAAISIGVGRRLHAVDSASQANCQSLRPRRQRTAGLHISLTAVALGVMVGAAQVASRLLS